MDPFVRKLVERLHAEGQPLSRNRHFHTFETPEGKLALRISRRLKSLERDAWAAAVAGHPPQIVECATGTGFTVQLSFVSPRGKRVTQLTREEFELLLDLPRAKEALQPTMRCKGDSAR